MTRAVRFDPSVHTVGLNGALEASLVPARPDPPIFVSGVTIGVAAGERIHGIDASRLRSVASRT